MNKELKSDFENLIIWAYNASFQTLFIYNRIDCSKKLSKTAEERIKKIIDKYGL